MECAHISAQHKVQKTPSTKINFEESRGLKLVLTPCVSWPCDNEDALENSNENPFVFLFTACALATV